MPTVCVSGKALALDLHVLVELLRHENSEMDKDALAVRAEMFRSLGSQCRMLQSGRVTPLPHSLVVLMGGVGSVRRKTVWVLLCALFWDVLLTAGPETTQLMIMA